MARYGMMQTGVFRWYFADAAVAKSFTTVFAANK